jgi:hypothetical protein
MADFAIADDETASAFEARLRQLQSEIAATPELSAIARANLQLLNAALAHRNRDIVVLQSLLDAWAATFISESVNWAGVAHLEARMAEAIARRDCCVTDLSRAATPDFYHSLAIQKRAAADVIAKALTKYRSKQ